VGAPQLNFITLACRDIEREADFLRALGWAESPESEPVHRLFQGTNGIVVALYGAANYEQHFGPRADGFRGFSFRDPEGNLWDVAWKRGSTVTLDGDLIWS
jgi:predicted lactoylglutathione lyase